jgi:hypothetical protein
VPRPNRAPKSEPRGFLGGLTAIGYTQISVDDIIKLREHGVDPGYIGAMMKAGLGTPGVDELIAMHDHGVRPDVLAKIAQSGAVNDPQLRNRGPVDRPRRSRQRPSRDPDRWVSGRFRPIR